MPTQLIVLASAILAVTGLLGAFWLARSRAARRVRHAANIYAARQLAQEARWKARKARLRAAANSN